MRAFPPAAGASRRSSGVKKNCRNHRGFDLLDSITLSVVYVQMTITHSIRPDPLGGLQFAECALRVVGRDTGSG